MSTPTSVKSGHSRHDTALIHGLSTSEVEKLAETCVEAKSRAYCELRIAKRQTVQNILIGNLGPYSKFRVGCSILLSGGSVVQGANVENAAYPVGTCAERVTIATAVVQVSVPHSRVIAGILMGLQGAKKGDIRAIAVATDISPPASPCGMCRQFIREFCEVSSMNDEMTGDQVVSP